VLHAPPSSFFSILSPAQYWVMTPGFITWTVLGNDSRFYHLHNTG
jgi:hypothetical protein